MNEYLTAFGWCRKELISHSGHNPNTTTSTFMDSSFCTALSQTGQFMHTHGWLCWLFSMSSKANIRQTTRIFFRRSKWNDCNPLYSWSQKAGHISLTVPVFSPFTAISYKHNLILQFYPHCIYETWVKCHNVLRGLTVLIWENLSMLCGLCLMFFCFTYLSTEVQYKLPVLCITVRGFAHCLDQQITS